MALMPLLASVHPRAESVAPRPCPPRALPEGQQRSFMVVRGLLASLQQAARYIGGVTGDLLRSWLQVRVLPPEQHPVFPAGTLIGSGFRPRDGNHVPS
jgi:hypothetical protein